MWFAFFLLALLAADKDAKERTYEEPFETVWKACVESALQVGSRVSAGKEDGLITFNRKRGFGVGATVIVKRISDNKTRVEVRPDKGMNVFYPTWGIIRPFFEAVEKRLPRKGNP